MPQGIKEIETCWIEGFPLTPSKTVHVYSGSPPDQGVMSANLYSLSLCLEQS